MAAAEPAALQALGDWGRFDLLPNRRTADLIFLLFANPYLGDYVTRDVPEIRPVHAAMATLTRRAGKFPSSRLLGHLPKTNGSMSDLACCHERRYFPLSAHPSTLTYN